jgi:predicted nucleotidyltransferase
MKVKDELFNKNPLLILSYLSKNNRMLYGRKIAEDIGINQGSTSIILKKFKEMGLLESENAGKTILYRVNKENPIIKHFRIFENLIEINDLVKSIKPYSREIILFGSCARGEDNQNSDIDFFVVADDDNYEAIREKIETYEIDREIKPIIVNSLELMEMEENDKVFLEEVNKGIKLWEGLEE